MSLIYVFMGFLGTELFSIFLHRYIFHGPLWSIHKSHHLPRKGHFEENDLFSLFFALVSIVLMAIGVFQSEYLHCLWIGLGISIYGGLYFVAHDLMAHNRYFPLKAKNPLLKALVRAHRHHHQRVDKPGQGPWGLFIYRYNLYRGKPRTSVVSKAIKAA